MPIRRSLGGTTGISSHAGLVCQRCNKSFEKEATYKRHGYYCASKQAGPLTSRKRSCKACSKAKTRCDSNLPACTNCISKNAPCQYDDSVLKSRAPLSREGTAPATHPNESRPYYANTEDPVSDIFSTTETTIDPSLLDFNDPYLGLECQSLPAQNNAHLASLEMPTRTSSYAFGGHEAPKSLDLLFQDPSMNPRMWPVEPCLNPRVSIFPCELDSTDPRSFQSWGLPRSFTPRPMEKTGAQMSAFILQKILGSYPEKMLRRDTFPPFIHPTCFSFGPENDQLPEPLANCMTVAQMFTARTKETSKLMWRTVRAEQERLWIEHYNYNDWELLASIQALMIYTLMRLVDGETEYNNFDIPLLISLNETTSINLSKRIGGGEYKESPKGDRQDWKEWIFYESRRRFVTVARIINRLVNIETAVTCHQLPGFALVPLPAKKALWESKNAASWRAEFNQSLKDREIFGLSIDGQLVKLQQEHEGLISGPASWESWYTGMDEFGTLAMLTATLL